MTRSTALTDPQSIQKWKFLPLFCDSPSVGSAIPSATDHLLCGSKPGRSPLRSGPQGMSKWRRQVHHVSGFRPEVAHGRLVTFLR